MATATMMHLYGSTNVAPVVGMGATILLYSDALAATIVEVGPRKVVVRTDKPVRRIGNSEGDWETEQDPNGTRWTFTLRSNGRWVAKGEGPFSGARLMIGFRREYRDPTF